MKSRLNLKPDQRGTKMLVEQYGKSLFYVRYRYVEEREMRLKTGEIVVEEKSWNLGASLLDGDIVPVRDTYDEKALRDRLKAVVGRWDPVAKLWHVPYGAIRGTELEEGIPVEIRKRKRRLKHPG